jgi:hypothetical protein
MASNVISRDLITVIAQEMSCAVERSVEYWIAQLDEVLTDTRLTTLGRLNSVAAVVAPYKHSPASRNCSRGKLAIVPRSIRWTRFPAM